MSYYTNIQTKEAIDNLLFDLVRIESNQGIDSTENDKWLADNDKKVVVKKIRDLDEDYYQDVFNVDIKTKNDMNEILITDIETTGFNVKKDKIVEIGIVRLNLKTGEKKVLFDKVVKESGITTARLKNSWIIKHSSLTVVEVQNALNISFYLDYIQEIIDDHSGITAFNNPFDFRFMESRGIKFPNKLPCLMKVAKPIVKAKGKKGIKNPSVQEAYDFFFPRNKYIEKHRGADDALHEADIALELYKRGKLK